MLPYGKSACRVRRTGMGNGVFANGSKLPRPSSALPSTSRAAGLTLPGSPITRTSDGCCKWPGTRPWRDAAPFSTVAIFCIIAIRNTPPPSGRLSKQVTSKLYLYRLESVRSVKDECLSKIILFDDRSLRRAISEYVTHYHTERNHQGKSNVVLSSRHGDARREAGAIPRATGWSFALLHQEAA
jgi:hypothetical protein